MSWYDETLVETWMDNVGRLHAGVATCLMVSALCMMVGFVYCGCGDRQRMSCASSLAANKCHYHHQS